MSLAMPFIVVRLVYFFLGVFDSSTQKWSILAGSIVPFLLMGLLMEYVVVCIYLATGFLISGWRDGGEMPGANDGRQTKNQTAFTVASEA